MEPKDQTTQPDRVAARVPATAIGSEARPVAQLSLKPAPTPVIPLKPAPTPVIGTPILSVAVAPATQSPFLGASGVEARAEPPLGVIEGVTLIEPRVDPGNDSELDSVILSPALTAEHAAREANARSATTVRTRARLRGNADGDAPVNTDATRRSATLLALLVAVALLLTGLSSLFRNGGASSAETAEPPKASAEQPQASRVDVQAASPQPQTEPQAQPSLPGSLPVELEGAALLPPPDAVEAPPSRASASRATTEAVSPRVAPKSKKSGARALPAPPQQPVSTHAAETFPTLPPSTPATSATGKSWIKVRE